MGIYVAEQRESIEFRRQRETLSKRPKYFEIIFWFFKFKKFYAYPREVCAFSVVVKDNLTQMY